MLCNLRWAGAGCWTQCCLYILILWMKCGIWCMQPIQICQCVSMGASIDLAACSWHPGPGVQHCAEVPCSVCCICSTYHLLSKSNIVHQKSILHVPLARKFRSMRATICNFIYQFDQPNLIGSMHTRRFCSHNLGYSCTLRMSPFFFPSKIGKSASQRLSTENW